MSKKKQKVCVKWQDSAVITDWNMTEKLMCFMFIHVMCTSWWITDVVNSNICSLALASTKRCDSMLIVNTVNFFMSIIVDSEI